MKRNDIIIAIICGLSVSWIAGDFLKKYTLIFVFALPILSVVGLYVTDLIGKKYLFVHQAGKFILAGAFADVVDIKIFQLLFWLIPASLLIKAISFILATFVKYYSDKHWSFEKHEKDHNHTEKAKFFVVATVGMLLNVAFFYFFTNIKVGIPTHLWIELSIILAAIAAGLWNFLGYKLIVFKK